MKLYYQDFSYNCFPIIAVAKRLGIDLELIPTAPMKGETRTSEYLKLNPNGKIPLLVDGNYSLWESNAILLYLAGQKTNDLWPEALQDRCDVYRWLFWQQAHWNTACGTLIWERVAKKMMGAGEPDPVEIKKALEKIERFSAVLNQCLEGKQYLVNNKLSLADYPIAALLYYAPHAQIPLDAFPHVKTWYQRIAALPEWQASVPKS